MVPYQSISTPPVSTHRNVLLATTSTPPIHHARPVPPPAADAHRPPSARHAHQAITYMDLHAFPPVPIQPML